MASVSQRKTGLVRHVYSRREWPKSGFAIFSEPRIFLLNILTKTANSLR